MNIKAKFKCESVEICETSETVKFATVYGGSEENKTWAKFTPSGSLTMQITNPDARGVFKPGAQYYLSFEEAPTG